MAQEYTIKQFLLFLELANFGVLQKRTSPKQFGRPRVKVTVLNPEWIPEFVDIVIGDYVYELQVEVEFKTEELNPLPIDMDTQPEEDEN